ncbi:hypothetical protein SAMN02745181_0129 [Rubritalea squalenifaciens DSM 18772]|uniref:Serine aminopeptidase S33 domain-containing protein n=1 Tax=Rubritalea squalenifaciens DSM 18772 TaxID=1123071 RepID=A0A1M6B645_9BACT|nr:alpha/beta fold hydrolase [Rubritalea squalenifaciens]SHI44229.1 hypothetical protein SAMN02745181_0129 [Rubritalea squalenifaciens DSM 18772]
MDIRNRHGEKIDHAFHEADRDDVLVVLAHGVTGDKDREMLMTLANGLAAKGWPAMRMSFSGNGHSEGDFRDSTVSKEVDDLHAVLDQVKGSKKIAYIGHSMGGAVGALAAAKDDRINVLVSLAGMVRTKDFCDTEFGEETPDSGYMWEDDTKPLSQAYVDDMHAIGDTFAAARDVRTPWLLIHGTEDDVVLPKDSDDLYLKLKGKKKLVRVEGADHMFANDYDLLIEEIDDWLGEHLG